MRMSTELASQRLLDMARILHEQTRMSAPQADADDGANSRRLWQTGMSAPRGPLTNICYFDFESVTLISLVAPSVRFSFSIADS